MLDRDTVQDWIEEENYETEAREPTEDELEWQLRVIYPRGSDYFIDIAHFSGRDTLVVFSQHQFTDVEVQKEATEWQLISFRFGVRSALLRLPIRFHFAPGEADQPIEFAGFERPLYNEELTKPKVMRALEDINRGLAVITNQIQQLQIQAGVGE